MSFEDLEAEKSINAGIIRHGLPAYSDASLWIKPVDFTDEYNRAIYECLAKHYEDGEERLVDHATLMHLAKVCGHLRTLDHEEATRHIRMLINADVELSTVEPEAQKLFKIGVRRRLSDIARKAQKDLHAMNGSETLAAIFAIVEDPINGYISQLGNGEFEGPKLLGVGGRERFLERLKNPNTFTGVPTQFPTYNKWIGGGYRPGTVSIIGARLKVGKTQLGMNIGLHVAKTLGYPVLFIDTEMSDREHEDRAWANISGVEIDKIENATTDERESELVLRAADEFAAMPYSYESVVSKSFEERCASMKRWASKTIKFDDDGNAEPALIIYDYLNLVDPSEMAKDLSTSENMGLNMLSLMKIAARFKIPILSFMQLNRDGEELNSAKALAMSDLPARSAANLALFKKKDEKQVVQDGVENGTRELTVPDARHGPGSQDDRLTLIFEGAICRITEGPLKSQIRHWRGDKPSGESTFAKSKPKPPRRKKVECDADPDPEPIGF